MTAKSNRTKRCTGRRTYSDELKAELVQMLADGHTTYHGWRQDELSERRLENRFLSRICG